MPAAAETISNGLGIDASLIVIRFVEREILLFVVRRREHTMIHYVLIRVVSHCVKVKRASREARARFL